MVYVAPYEIAGDQECPTKPRRYGRVTAGGRAGCVHAETCCLAVAFGDTGPWRKAGQLGN